MIAIQYCHEMFVFKDAQEVKYILWTTFFCLIHDVITAMAFIYSL